jgi:O-acetyl-ADP-ribose deacetylase (regulator of RNase III)
MFDEDSFTIEYRQGDLLELRVAGIACNVNIELDLNYGLGQAVLQKAGGAVKQQLDRLFHERAGHSFPLGVAISTEAGNLPPPVKRLIFVTWWGRDNEYTANHVFRCHAAAIREADRYALTSLAFPLMGRGHRLDFRVMAEGIALAINDLHGLPHRFSLQHLVFGSLSQSDLDQLREALEERLDL